MACIFNPKNPPKTLPKRGPNPSKFDAENVLLFNIDFFGFRPRFWSVLGLQLGAKSAALLAAPGVLKPTEFYACFNILRVLTRGRPRSPKTQGRSRPCWGHVGSFFALGRLFCALGWFLSDSCTFFSHVGRFFRTLGRSGLD